ncbi:MAG: hypothetical protein ABI609_12515 [Acidobacteriota bacterium]
MKNSLRFARSLVLPVMLLIASTPIVAQPAAADRGNGRYKVIALQYRVYDAAGRQRGGTMAAGDSTEARVGETLRFELVGTALINNVGREIPIDATFEVAAGRGNIDLARTTRSSATVTVKNDSGGLAQVGFTVSGNYDVLPKNSFGRLTLQISGGGEQPGSSPGTSAERARELTDAFYRSLLNTRASGNSAATDYDRILAHGYGGAIEVGLSVARDAEQQGMGRSERDRGYEAEDMRRLGTLYRELLKRQQTDSDLWNSDRGFAGNVRELHKRNLTPVVETILRSDEFRRAWGFDASTR